MSGQIQQIKRTLCWLAGVISLLDAGPGCGHGTNARPWIVHLGDKRRSTWPRLIGSPATSPNPNMQSTHLHSFLIPRLHAHQLLDRPPDAGQPWHLRSPPTRPPSAPSPPRSAAAPPPSYAAPGSPGRSRGRMTTPPPRRCPASSWTSASYRTPSR
jgi:hypothetical protein